MFYLYSWPILCNFDIKAQIIKDLIKLNLWDLHKSLNYFAKIKCFFFGVWSKMFKALSQYKKSLLNRMI